MSLHSVPSGSGYKYSFVFMKRLSQVLAWVLVFGIVGLSIVPADYRISTNLPRPFEHLSISFLPVWHSGLVVRTVIQCRALLWCSSLQPSS